MSLSLTEYLARPPATQPQATPCASCGCALPAATGRQTTEQGVVCEDCYFDALGDLVECHPIGRATA